MTDPIATTDQTADTLFNDMPLDVAGAARELGLKPVRAWVPDEKQKARSVGAERVRRCREQAERQGLKQLSIMVPIELHPILKTLATRTKAGEPLSVVLGDLVPQSSKLRPDTADEHLNASFAWLDALPAWRRWLLRRLLPRSVTKPQ
jgi:hypothetical protein